MASDSAAAQLFVASAIKTFIVCQYLRDVEAGRLSEDEQLPVNDSVRNSDSAVLLDLTGTTPARSILEAMITHSDNTATDIALLRVGPNRVRSFIAAFACLIGMNFTVRRSGALTAGLLFAVGALLGIAMSPTLLYYASANPQALWQAGGATALFIAGFGAAGYATRRDLSGIARVSFFALIALIVFGIVLIFVRIPHGSLIYSVLGLVIFAGLTMFDFQRLRRSSDLDSAPFIAASIFLDALNVFLFFLRIFGGRNN